jgi:hypothetical protein
VTARQGGGPALVLGSWAFCGLVYATNGGGGYTGGVFFALLIFVAAASTLGAATTVVDAWRAEVRLVAAAVVSIVVAKRLRAL